MHQGVRQCPSPERPIELWSDFARPRLHGVLDLGLQRTPLIKGLQHGLLRANTLIEGFSRDAAQASPYVLGDLGDLGRWSVDNISGRRLDPPEAEHVRQPHQAADRGKGSFRRRRELGRYVDEDDVELVGVEVKSEFR